MTISLPVWAIPTALSVAFLALMFRPYHQEGMYDFGAILRLFWVVPILVVWLVYFAFT